MNNFSISLQDLFYGWATIKFESREQELIHTVSSVTSDALSCLIYSALNAAQNKPYQTRFFLEPDYLSYEVKPHDGEIYIIIGDIVFSSDIKRYVRQILKMFDGYLFSHSEEEYAAQWYCSYPKNEIEKLRGQLKII